ncbi:MAG TPA: hypothetical protein PLY00_02915 [Verrucomicrobiota bacterium]|nr:hypothetical protein [Verrucomicrobiota bacterium]HOR70226.1 hypothetical protein [Verrucomicrobiota bacterium]HOU86577.1 hypothetical protein [Verrucomicrobiota bacterium]HPK96884.1 hypothetical protein [Verrucomicrobiota bacterium]HQF58171.1 hypothetical protein [Verrucomicrobiota bacterium]
MKRNPNLSSPAKPGKVWQKTPSSNLLRYVPSGFYFARIRVGGKLIRRSLESTVLSVAKLKLADLKKEERTRLENHKQFGSGKATFDDLLAEYRTRLEANHSIALAWPQGWRRIGNESLSTSSELTLGEHGAEGHFQ